jgi:hypothetical protein
MAMPIIKNHSPRRLLAVTAAVMLTALVALAPAASAHGGDETDKAAVLVRQAIAVMVNEPDNAAAAADKLNDASTASDQTGVEANLLSEAKAALEAGDMHKARSLAEESIGAQPHLATAEPPAIGETTPTFAGMPGGGASGAAMTMAAGAEPGQATFSDPLEVRPELTGRNWAVLAGSIIAGLVGVYLVLRFRPTRREVQS